MWDRFWERSVLDYTMSTGKLLRVTGAWNLGCSKYRNNHTFYLYTVWCCSSEQSGSTPQNENRKCTRDISLVVLSIKYECTFVALVIQHATPCCRLWPFLLHHIFPHYLIYDTILGRKLLIVKHVCWFFLYILYYIYSLVRYCHKCT